MSTWKGWEAALLTTLAVPDTPGNRAFLTDWARTSGTTCKDNPLAATLPFGGSAHCTHLGGSTYVQAYSTHGHGIAATAKQLEQPEFASILGALKTGLPLGYPDWALAVDQLDRWPAHAFAVRYGKLALAAQPSGSGSGAAAGAAPRSLAGYHHFAQQLVHTIPEQLRRSQHLRVQALAKLRAKA